MLYCEITQTAPRVEGSFAVQGMSRTSLYTCATTAASHFQRSVGSGFSIPKNLCEKYSRAHSGDYQLIVKPYETYPGPDSPVPLPDRSRIYTYPCRPAESLGYRSQCLAEYDMIIVAKRIIRKKSRPGIFGRSIGKRTAYHRLRSGHEQDRITADISVILKITHIGVRPGGEPPVETVGRLIVDRLHRGDSDSYGSGPAAEFFYCVGIHRHSITSVRNSKPCSLSHSIARGRAHFMFFSALSESWNTIMEPLRAYRFTLPSTCSGVSFFE